MLEMHGHTPEQWAAMPYAERMPWTTSRRIAAMDDLQLTKKAEAYVALSPGLDGQGTARGPCPSTSTSTSTSTAAAAPMMTAKPMTVTMSPMGMRRICPGPSAGERAHWCEDAEDGGDLEHNLGWREAGSLTGDLACFGSAEEDEPSLGWTNHIDQRLSMIETETTGT
ncbi:MAG: hypothetical protein E5W28_06340 [Mesorhizobium sp.]|nr:MAG: hypothetical protein E5W28_06340 [Mesorhizobium sp.]